MLTNRSLPRPLLPALLICSRAAARSMGCAVAVPTCACCIDRREAVQGDGVPHRRAAIHWQRRQLNLHANYCLLVFTTHTKHGSDSSMHCHFGTPNTTDLTLCTALGRWIVWVYTRHGWFCNENMFIQLNPPTSSHYSSDVYGETDITKYYWARSRRMANLKLFICVNICILWRLRVKHLIGKN